MARSGNQKTKLLYLARIFEQETDENHGLSMAQIVAKLDAVGISADRKALYQDFEELRHFGYDIITDGGSKNITYRLASRDFELAELKLLVDSVQSSRFITQKKSSSLIKKLEGLVSKYDAHQLHRQVLIAGRVKTMNESIYYNVDKLHAAINAGVQIRFKYFHWNTAKQEEFGHGGGWYQVSPWHLRWDDENYYLIAFDAESGQLRHYRVDKMRQINATDLPRLGREEMRNFDPTAYTQRLFGMYGGEPAKVTMEVENSLVGVIIDRFGKDIPVVPLDENHFYTHVEAAVSPQFLGWAASLGSKAKITGPRNVVEQMQQLTQDLAKMYLEQA